jgi:hypothetical protein
MAFIVSPKLLFYTKWDVMGSLTEMLDGLHRDGRSIVAEYDKVFSGLR